MKFKLLILLVLLCSGIQAQELNIRVVPANPEMNVGETLNLKAEIIDAQNNVVKDRDLAYYSFNDRAMEIDSTGMLTAHAPGTHTVIIISPSEDGNYLRKDITVNVAYPPIEKLTIGEIPQHIYAGTSFPVDITVLDAKGLVRDDVQVTFSSSDEEVASTDAFGQIHAKKPGKAMITASAEGITANLNIQVIDNPVVSISLTSEMEQARTGDVFHFSARALDKNGNAVSDAPITFTYSGVADDVSSNAEGLIKNDGRFVANEPGLYTVTASSGPNAAKKTVRILPRNVQRKLELVGHGTVNTKHTSDFWVWEGVDGRDYAVTGTWGADGTAYFWDVTDPANITRIDSVQVDARTVNDVKISEDGKICIISREGASNRKNGIVIIDVTNPRDVEVISTFTENLTGGVHNLFIYQDHVYALSNGELYYVINIEDPKEPRIVGKFELDTPGHAIHDVWVEDGIAYSSNWSDGVYMVDVGNGIAGGSPENPVAFGHYEYPSGAHHATFPFKSESTNKFYAILGDEIFPYGLDVNSDNVAGGFLHFVDFTDLENPEEIARFQVPGAGSHNYWVDGDMLYVAYYNGGVRVVDISGELMGDLYNQGREVAWILPADPNGYIPNAPFTWGAQLHKGHIFYSDWNSGLWAAKLEPEKPKDVNVESK